MSGAVAGTGVAERPGLASCAFEALVRPPLSANGPAVVGGLSAACMRPRLAVDISEPSGVAYLESFPDTPFRRLDRIWLRSARLPREARRRHWGRRRDRQ